jgi:hypothetical protein
MVVVRLSDVVVLSKPSAASASITANAYSARRAKREAALERLRAGSDTMSLNPVALIRQDRDR